MFGLIGRKWGMSRIFDAGGRVEPVTVVRFEPSLVLREKTAEKDGYVSKVLATEDLKEKKKTVSVGGVSQTLVTNSTKAHRGQFRDWPLKRCIYECRDFEPQCVVGDFLDVSLFAETEYVDVVGTSKGKGFQGGMKRHGFKGGPAGHGSKFHRGLGATGVGANNMGRLFPGTKLPGRMGAKQRTTQNLKIVKIDADQGFLFLSGSVPGPRMGRVFVRKAKKK